MSKKKTTRTRKEAKAQLAEVLTPEDAAELAEYDEIIARQNERSLFWPVRRNG